MADLDPSEQTVDELRDKLDSIDDPESLQELRETETDGEDRTGAVEAIDDRLDELDEDTEDGTDEETNTGDTSDGTPGIVEVRDGVRNAAADLIGRPLDSIVEIERDDDDWHALVEIVERRSVPDTQDILGRYALTLDGDAAITGYRRLDRYRRGDTRSDEEPPQAL